MIETTIRTPRSILREIIAQVARERMVAPELIEGRSRQRNVMNARVVVARRLVARGMSEERIARMLHVSVPTVENWQQQTTKGD
jgi:DNA-binding transcriptional regulator YiaG